MQYKKKKLRQIQAQTHNNTDNGLLYESIESEASESNVTMMAQ